MSYLQGHFTTYLQNPYLYKDFVTTTNLVRHAIGSFLFLTLSLLNGLATYIHIHA